MVRCIKEIEWGKIDRGETRQISYIYTHQFHRGSVFPRDAVLPSFCEFLHFWCELLGSLKHHICLFSCFRNLCRSDVACVFKILSSEPVFLATKDRRMSTQSRFSGTQRAERTHSSDVTKMLKLLSSEDGCEAVWAPGEGVIFRAFRTKCWHLCKSFPTVKTSTSHLPCRPRAKHQPLSAV